MRNYLSIFPVYVLQIEVEIFFLFSNRHLHRKQGRVPDWFRYCKPRLWHWSFTLIDLVTAIFVLQLLPIIIRQASLIHLKHKVWDGCLLIFVVFILEMPYISWWSWNGTTLRIITPWFCILLGLALNSSLSRVLLRTNSTIWLIDCFAGL